MDKKYAIKFDYKTRTKLNSTIEDCPYLAIGVIAVLRECKRLQKYLVDLKSKLKSEGSELFGNIEQLEMICPEGRV